MRRGKPRWTADFGHVAGAKSFCAGSCARGDDAVQAKLMRQGLGLCGAEEPVGVSGAHGLLQQVESDVRCGALLYGARPLSSIDLD